MPATQTDIDRPGFWRHMHAARRIVDNALVNLASAKKTESGNAVIAANRDAHRARVIDDLAALLSRVEADRETGA